MSIKFHIFVDHKALPSKAVAPKQKWKTFLGAAAPIVDTFTRLLLALFLAGSVWADGSTHNTPAETVQTKIKTILDPVRGLNSEIQVGLQKIEKTCAIISKSKINESKQMVAASLETKQQILKTELANARQITIEQNQLTQTKLEVSRLKVEALTKSCETSKTVISDSCKQNRNNAETLTKVTQASALYYSEALARLTTYEQANELENNGCTRAGFAYRLWSAEQAHLFPTLKNSAEFFNEMLN